MFWIRVQLLITTNRLYQTGICKSIDTYNTMANGLHIIILCIIYSPRLWPKPLFIRLLTLISPVLYRIYRTRKRVIHTTGLLYKKKCTIDKKNTLNFRKGRPLCWFTKLKFESEREKIIHKSQYKYDCYINRFTILSRVLTL